MNAGPDSSRNKGLILHTDGAARGNPGPAAIGVVAELGGVEVFTISKYIGVATNNMAEYMAVIAGLEKVRELGIGEVTVKMDSELVVQQLNGGYKVRNARLKELYSRARKALEGLDRCYFVHLPREKNTAADRLANLALDRALKKKKGAPDIFTE